MKAFITFLILFLTLFPVKSQDPQFSQFYAAPLYLAPSLSGTTDGTRLAINFRDQWPSLPGSFVTYMFALDHYIYQYNSGIGLMMMRDQAGGGKLNTTNISGQYSYDIKLNNIFHLRPGLAFMYYQRNIDYHSLTFMDQIGWEQINPTSVEIPSDEDINHFNFGTSMLLYCDKFWVGVTADHLMKANPSIVNNEDYNPIKYSLYSGYSLSLNRVHYKKDGKKLFIASHFKMQGRDQQLDLGAYFNREPIMFGLWYRGIPVFKESPSHDALSVLLGYTIKGVTVGYSYDFTISRLITSTGGAHEISLIYKFNQDQKSRAKKRVKDIPCPSI